MEVKTVEKIIEEINSDDTCVISFYQITICLDKKKTLDRMGIRDGISSQLAFLEWFQLGWLGGLVNEKST